MQDRYVIAQETPQVIVKFRRIAEQGDMAVIRQHGKALHDRILGQIAAADIQQP